MDERTTDLVEKAWMEIINQEMDQIPSEEELRKQYHLDKSNKRLVDFDNIIVGPWKETLEEKTIEILKKQRFAKRSKKYLYIRKYKYSRIAIYCLVIVLIFTCSFTVYAMYKTKFIDKFFTKNTDISIEDGEKSDKFKDLYLPNYMISNYVFFMSIENGSTVTTTYMSNSSDEIQLKQQWNTDVLSIDSENAIQQKIMINNSEAIFYNGEEKLLLIWEEYGYIFCLSTQDPNVSKENMIKIANSIENTKN